MKQRPSTTLTADARDAVEHAFDNDPTFIDWEQRYNGEPDVMLMRIECLARITHLAAVGASSEHDDDLDHAADREAIIVMAEATEYAVRAFRTRRNRGRETP